VALFVLIAVGIIAVQTWLDWRGSNTDWVMPDWAKGIALAAIIAVSLTAATSFTSVWLQNEASQESSVFGSAIFRMEFGFLLCVMGGIALAVRRKQMRPMALLGASLAIALWLGIAILS
jgi:hypothetical protein